MNDSHNRVCHVTFQQIFSNSSELGDSHGYEGDEQLIIAYYFLVYLQDVVFPIHGTPEANDTF